MENKNVMFSRPSCMGDAMAEIGVSTYLAQQRCMAPDSSKYVLASSRSYQDEEYTYFVSDYMEKGELFNHVKARGGFPEPIAKEWARQVLEGLAWMHSHGVAHRDISLENVLLGSDHKVCIIDFAQAVRIFTGAEERPAKHRGRAGKQYYRAPEMYCGEYEAQRVDAFAVGVLIFIMVLGVPPWDSALDDDQRFRFIQANGLQRLITAWRMEDRMSPVLVDLLSKLLKKNPQDRLTIEDARQHMWFEQKERFPKIDPDLDYSTRKVVRAGQAESAENIYIDTYNKTPKEFLDALFESPLLKACRLDLLDAGHSWLLDSGAKVFVRPHQWDLVMQAVEGKDLRKWHVIVAAEFSNLVEESLSEIRSRTRPKKQRELLAVDEVREDMNAADAEIFDEDYGWSYVSTASLYDEDERVAPQVRMAEPPAAPVAEPPAVQVAVLPVAVPMPVPVAVPLYVPAPGPEYRPADTWSEELLQTRMQAGQSHDVGHIRLGNIELHPFSNVPAGQPTGGGSMAALQELRIDDP
jgi:serine/threonine protein kinase